MENGGLWKPPSVNAPPAEWADHYVHLEVFGYSPQLAHTCYTVVGSVAGLLQFWRSLVTFSTVNTPTEEWANMTHSAA